MSLARRGEMNTGQRGDLSELIVMASAIASGKSVARVYGNSKPFDLLVEMTDGQWVRVQIKTVLQRRKNKFIPCARSKSVTSIPRNRKYQNGAFDILAGVDRSGEVRLVPFNRVYGKTQIAWDDPTLTTWEKLL